MPRAIRFDKGTIVAERYEIGEPLGDGGMGVVYTAKRFDTGEPCAIKFIRPELVTSDKAVEKFLKEAEITARLGSHPNIVRVLETGVDDVHHLPFIVMELLEGEELMSWAAKRQPLAPASLCPIFEQLGAALGEAHAAGVVHRDLKQTNLFVCSGEGGEPRLKVLDFGIAKTLENSAQTATIIGTPQYCAPEQMGATMRKLAAEKGYTIATGVSPATDVYAMALIAYELLTGSDIGTYWGASEIAELMMRTAMEPRPRPSERAGLAAARLPAGFDDWFLRATAHNSFDRFGSAAEAVSALTRVLRGVTALETSPTTLAEPIAATIVGTPLVSAPPVAPTAAGETLVAAPPAPTLVEPPAPFDVGPPHAPPAMAQPVKKSGGAWVAMVAVVLVLVLVGGGGFAAFKLVSDRAQSSSDGEEEEEPARPPRERAPTPPKLPPSSHDTAKIAVRADDPTWGEHDAPATIVVFSDYQCPYCSRVETTLTALRAKYGEKQLRIVWKDFPLDFHKDAGPAHVAARAVYEAGGATAFWRFHALAFMNQKELTPTNFEAWATVAGVPPAKLAPLLVDPKTKARVDANIADGKSYGVRGTPAFFVNGIMLSGARPQTDFEAKIDSQIVEAAALVASGTPKNRVYIDLTAKNFTGPTPAPTPSPSTADSTTVWKIPVLKTDPVKGNRDALVTIVEISDFECPFCAKVQPTLAQVLTDYGSKVRIVWKDNPLPFHKRALPAALAAREVYAQLGDSGFWAMHDTLFANQKALDDFELSNYAYKAGANVDRVKDAIVTERGKTFIEVSQELASDFDASGTPHFFINGRRLTGAQPYDDFKKIIDEEIIVAQKLVSSGVAPSALYDELIKHGKEPAPLEKKSVGPPPANAPEKGGKSAKVVIQVFSDFQCPFCKRVNTTLAQVLGDYGDKVKVVWRHHPLAMHKDAHLAAEAAAEAFAQKGNAGFWKMHDKLFDNQSALSQADLERYAGEIGLDVVRFRNALIAGVHRASVDHDATAATGAGISGTPAFVINGYFISGAQSYAKFKKVIDRALKEAP
jgi:protein-disulfide isomerase/serine/threonine protein kinase